MNMNDKIKQREISYFGSIIGRRVVITTNVFDKWISRNKTDILECYASTNGHNIQWTTKVTGSIEEEEYEGRPDKIDRREVKIVHAWLDGLDLIDHIDIDYLQDIYDHLHE